MAKKGQDLTSPMSWAKSGAQALSGTPMAETDTGKAVGAVVEGNKGTIDSLKSLPGKAAEFAEHPARSIKEHVINHPISSAVDAASIALPALRGAAETGAKYAGRFGENQMGRLHGASSRQYRALGKENFEDTMRHSFKHGDADFTRGSIGRDEAIDQRVKDIGADVGSFRNKANAVGAQRTPQEMAAEIRRRALQDFVPGGKKFDDAASFEKHVKNIEAMPEGGINRFAERASDINRGGKQGKLIRNVSAETDVADNMARINDEDLSAKLGQTEAGAYGAAKKEFGLAKNLQKVDDFAEGKERLAPMKGTAVGLVKDALSTVVGGPKLGAKVGFSAEAALQNVSKNAGSYALGGLGATLVDRINSNPQSFGRYAAPLQKAAAEGGPQGAAAMHYILSTTHPDYNEMTQQD